MNTYTKFCPNVFVAKCDQEYEKGEEIILTTKYGKEHECFVHNFLFSREGFFYYSITRADGYTSQDRAASKAERIQGWANNARKRSNDYYEASNEGADFLRLAEPIKVGHHSEKRHRALIERNWNRMSNSVAESKKADDYEGRISYWDKLAEKVDLSMPESLEFFTEQLEEAKDYHTAMKEGKVECSHGFSLTYANKRVNDLKKKVELATRLWA